jgi:hypothetical protein
MTQKTTTHNRPIPDVAIFVRNVSKMIHPLCPSPRTLTSTFLYSTGVGYTALYAASLD